MPAEAAGSVVPQYSIPRVLQDMTFQFPLYPRGPTRRSKADWGIIKDRLDEFCVSRIPEALPFLFKNHPDLQQYFSEDAQHVSRSQADGHFDTFFLISVNKQRRTLSLLLKMRTYYTKCAPLNNQSLGSFYRLPL